MTVFPADVPGAPRSTDTELLAHLAADLRALDYTDDGVTALIGADAHAALHREQTVPALLACRAEDARSEPNPLAAVVHVWLLGGDSSETRLDRAFPRTGTAGLVSLRLLEPGPGDSGPGGSGASESGYRAAVDLRPHSSDTGGNLWVASDLGQHQRPGVLRRDHVLGIGRASLTLAQLASRAPVRRALDLGTGCGIQTFHLLAHARHVTATDLSARALAFTRFNLLLNARQLDIDPDDPAERVTLLQGSLLEPVEGETFDLVVSNPPFVITPRRAGEGEKDRFTYRDGGLPGDDVVSTLVRTIPGILNPGGTAQLLGNWEIPAAAGWEERLRTWIPPRTDAWFIQRERLTPLQYAETWLRDAAEHRAPELFQRRYADYLQDFASRRVEAVGLGMIWLRARSGPGETLRRFEEISHDIEQPLGPHLSAAVERHDWLGAHGEDFAAQRLYVPDDVTEERHQRPGAEHPGVILLRQGAGLRRTSLLSTELAGFVSACDGGLTAGQIAGALAALLDREGAGFRADLLREVRRLVEDRFLAPAGE